MKALFSLFFLVLCTTATAQEKFYRPARWMFSAAASGGANYTLYKLGGSFILNDHHVMGIAAGLVPYHRDEGHYNPGASYGYSYYFRKLGKRSVNFFTACEMDYYRYKRNFENIPLHMRNGYLYGHVGAGISFRYFKNMTTSLAASYIWVTFYNHHAQWTNTNGEEESFSSSGTDFGTPDPWMFSLKMGYLIR